jgi:hypothetical protein
MGSYQRVLGEQSATVPDKRIAIEAISRCEIIRTDGKDWEPDQ